MSTSKNDLYVITQAKKLVQYVLERNMEAPKKYRYSFLSRIENTCMDIVSLLYEANDIQVGDSRRRNKQLEVKTRLKILDFLCYSALCAKCYLFSQYQTISALINDCSKSLEAWIKSDDKRVKTSSQ